MTDREFRLRLAQILERQREERLEAIRADVRAEKKPPASETKNIRAKKKA